MKIFINIFFLCIATNLFAADSLKLIQRIPMRATIMTTDKAGSVYCAKTNHTIYRYDLNGDSTGFFSVIRKGDVTQIDATNPMRLLVFCAGVPQLYFLDRMLSAKNSIDLKQLKIYDCPAIAYSADGLTWAFNTINSELIKIDDDSKTTTASFNLLQLLQTNVQPVYITEQERTLFVVDTTLGILKFDQFGTYISTYHFFPKEMQYVNEQLIFYKNGEVISYNTKTIQEQKLQLYNPENILNARIERNRLYVLRKDCLEIFALF
ncbi:MAG: hypothetical protein RLZZ118_1708 [Bacteroidota bacterium]|jgi:hypothetical protein